MKCYKLYAMAFALTLMSCFEVENPSVEEVAPPKAPDEITIDVNNDGVTDFFTTSHVERRSGGGQYTNSEMLISWLRIASSNVETHFLYKRRDNHSAFFLSDGDSLTSEDKYETFWTGYWTNYAVKSATGTTNFDYPDEWRILIEGDMNQYIVGYKILDEQQETYMGWIEFSVKKKDGSIAVVDFSEPQKAEMIVVKE